MTAEPGPDTERLVAEAARLSRAVSGLGATTSPPAAGTDGTAQVGIRLGPDGYPAEITVGDGWRRHLEPSRLAAAVLDAAQDAARAAARRRSHDLGENALPSGSPSVAEPGLGELPGGEVRDVNELAEAVIRALQESAAASRAIIAAVERPPVAEGADDGRRVSLAISGGLLSGCRIDESWAARQDGQALGTALTQAARRAAAALPAPRTARGDRLLADVLATDRHERRQNR